MGQAETHTGDPHPTLCSMTGFGQARLDLPGGGYLQVEAKSVNQRFLKCSVKLPAAYAALEMPLEAAVRQRLGRGAVTLSVHVCPAERLSGDTLVDEAVVLAYREVFERLGIGVSQIALLPGVLRSSGTVPLPPLDAALQAAVLACAEAALKELVAMRRREGTGLRGLLLGLCGDIEAGGQALRLRAPAVVLEYQRRLQLRLEHLLQAAGSTPGAAAANLVDPQLLAQQVALYADRCDITEELDRLALHIEQVRRLVNFESVPGGSTKDGGRTLDFLAQEMHREINTVGAKSADGALAQQVIACKTSIERLKEQVQNVE